MAGSRALGIPKTSASSLREQLARTTLQNVRAKGHPYVELREDGKRFVFFCTLCLSPCYSDSALHDHLRGNLHNARLSAAKATLFGPNPWPFSDGVLFFDILMENGKQLAISDGKQNRLLEYDNNDDNRAIISDGKQNSLLGYDNNDDNRAIIKYDENLQPNCNSHDEVHSGDEFNDCTKNLDKNGGSCDLVIPGLLVEENISDLKVRFTGFGHIGARFIQKDENPNGIRRIWCEWLGKKCPDVSGALQHDFAIVTFAYNFNLGRKGLDEDLKYLLPSSPLEELEYGKGNDRKRKKSFSDPEDISESLRNGHDSSEEDSTSSKLLVDRCDDPHLPARIMSSKSMRRELRRQQRVLAEKMCDICQQKMLPEKDVAAILNVKTGKLACSSRNVNGAFHVFHTSCLIHWFILCELEIATSQSVSVKGRRRYRKKSGTKQNEIGKNGGSLATMAKIVSLFCPECQGTGINTLGDELERPTVSLSQMFRYKIKVGGARKAWMKDPELLDNCSVGLHFPFQSEEPVQEKVSTLKLLRFYSADA